MTTRRSKDKSVLNQSRYASSPEFERGLVGNMVAKRAALLDDAADRELLWFLQHLSHQEGGLEAFAQYLISKYPDRIQTAEMAKLGIKPGMICDGNQVRAIRGAFDSAEFLLKGETSFLDTICSRGRRHDEWDDDSSLREHRKREVRRALLEIDPDLEEKAKSYPTSYVANEFFDLCRNAAECDLLNDLQKLCLDPSISLKTGPWYFPRLIETLREYQIHYVKSKQAGVVTTALGAKVCEVLDYTAFCRGLTLIEGEARRGKSFAARKWCEQHPGKARFVEVPTGNDDVGFFRELARGLGVGNFLNYKAVEIRARVESVLLTGDLVLVLDEAHRLWPQRNLRYAYPSRISWVMAMANHHVPICCIATPQFIEMQKVAQAQGRWNSAQLTGRTLQYEFLPTELSEEDLQAVAKSVLPEADTQVLRVLATYARTSDRYLAAIDSISTRARFIAARAGRKAITSADVRIAMKESVIPSDTRLHMALDADRKRNRRGNHVTEPVPAQQPAPTRPNPSEDFHHTRDQGSRISADSFSRTCEASLTEV